MKPKNLIACRATSGAHVGCPFCSIIPAHMMRGLAQNGDEQQRSRALSTMLGSHRLRGQRDMLGVLGAVALMTPAGVKRRTIYNAQQQSAIPGVLVRGEGGAKGKDVAVNEAYDYAGAVYDFFSKVYERNSVDDRGMRLDSTVHFREDPTEPFDNAFWNGSQMIYGDGDGVAFGRFTKCLDVIGHELTHGITQYEAGLEYHGQSGALNESFSDVFGSLVKQWKKKQKADKADWLIGAGLLAKGVNGVALRSLKAPGTAYDDPVFGGKDPQPDHMKNYVKLADTRAGDNGGVHLNSGIPNHAFYLVATKLGGFAWEGAGRIWYDALCNRIRSNASFKTAAQATLASASSLYGSTSTEAKAVKSSWQEVGVL